MPRTSVAIHIKRPGNPGRTHRAGGLCGGYADDVAREDAGPIECEYARFARWERLVNHRHPAKNWKLGPDTETSTLAPLWVSVTVPNGDEIPPQPPERWHEVRSKAISGRRQWLRPRRLLPR